VNGDKDLSKCDLVTPTKAAAVMSLMADFHPLQTLEPFEIQS